MSPSPSEIDVSYIVCVQSCPKYFYIYTHAGLCCDVKQSQMMYVMYIHV